MGKQIFWLIKSLIFDQSKRSLIFYASKKLNRNWIVSCVNEKFVQSTSCLSIQVRFHSMNFSICFTEFRVCPIIPLTNLNDKKSKQSASSLYSSKWGAEIACRHDSAMLNWRLIEWSLTIDRRSAVRNHRRWKLIYYAISCVHWRKKKSDRTKQVRGLNIFYRINRDPDKLSKHETCPTIRCRNATRKLSPKLKVNGNWDYMSNTSILETSKWLIWLIIWMILVLRFEV